MRAPVFRYATMIAVAVAGLCASSAQAGSVAKSFQVTGYYGVSCSASLAGNFYMGLINPPSNVTNTAYQVSSAVIVNCSSALPFGVWSALSSNANGTQRRMYNAASNAYAGYNLYLDYPNNVLMPTSSTSSGFTAIANQQTFVSGITAVLPSGTRLNGGHYEDNIVITVSY